MRKWLAILLAAMLLLSLAACGGNGDGDESSSSAPVSSEDSTDESSAPADDPSTPDESEPISNGTSTTTAGRARSTTTTTGKVTTTTKPAFEYSTANEKPVTYDISVLYNEMHSASDTEAEAMKKTVQNAKDTVKASTSGTTYYVSYKGNDKNDGKSAAKAWRTTKRVGEAVGQFKSGDVVLFERGGVYRGAMQVVSGMKVGAYGSGSKPQLYAGPCNVADAKYWEKTKYDNVWKLNVAGLKDIGNIVFDHGKVCASTTRMFKEFLITDAKYKPQDFYYYHNVNKGYVYMYYSKGNPGAAFDSIELCPHDVIINDYAPNEIVKDVVVDNLCLRYTGAFGVQFGNCSNITITNCEMGYIGGSLQNASVRYGNGIELNGVVNGALIKNNWIYQCYDAGYTHQCGGDEVGIRVDANLIEYCNYNVEFFLHKDDHIEAVIENNILRFAGYGFGTKNRFGSSDIYASNICGTKQAIDSKGSVIRNNIIDTSYRSLVVVSHTDGVNGPKFEGNTWIQWNDKNSSVANLRDQGNVAHDDRNQVQPATDQATMQASVAKIDSTAKEVKFYSK